MLEDYTVRAIPTHDALELVIARHYLHRRAPVKYGFGLFNPKNELVGVVTFGIPPSHTLLKGICGPDEWQSVIELNRLWVDDAVPKNGESYLVSRAIHQIKDYEIIVSFADSAQGHVGYIYQALNFMYCGLSAKFSDPVVLGREGNHHTSYRGMSVKEIREKYGAENVVMKERSRKHRYILFNTSKSRKRQLLKKLKYTQQPYPKLEQVVVPMTQGKIKAKGGVVAKWAGGDFESNSATIIDAAVLSFLLDNVPISDTIDACNDIERFQIVAKAGRTFSKVVHQIRYPLGDKPWVDCEGVEREDIVQRVNRVYATIEPWYGGIYKVKMEDGKEVSRQRVPLTPAQCFVDNENLWQKNGDLALTTLDKSWYVALATEKAKAFITRDKKEKDQMSEVTETTNELKDKPKPTRKKADAKDTAQVPYEVAPVIPSFKQRLLALQGDMAKAATGVKFDKVIDNISYEYADTSQYKTWLAALCTNHDLIFKLDVDVKFLGIIGQTKAKADIYAAQADGAVTMRDVYTDEFETYCISGFGSNGQPGYCNGAAQTNMLRNFILNNYLLDNKGREGDDQAFSAATDSNTAKNGYVSGAAKAEIKQAIVDDKAEAASFATDMFAKALYEKVIEAQKTDPTFCVKMVAEHFDADGTPKVGANGKSTLKKTKAVAALTKAEEIIATAETVAE